MNIEVTTVSKKEEKLFQTAAAIYVITKEDIRRSGMTSIPELLRLAPGLAVARIDGSTWAITARGFNGRFANKMLVLIDGRSVYTPLFSGVLWDGQDVLLEDVERIEVIRGPGGTLWGANAVNGVINIITKHANDTQDGLMSAGSGSDERGFGSFRWGGKLGRQTYYRVYTKYFNRDIGNDASEHPIGKWDMLRGGFRLDWKGSDHRSLTWQGDLYRGNQNQAIPFASPFLPQSGRSTSRSEISGGNLLARWSRVNSDDSDMRLQGYYDRSRREDLLLDEIRNTLDLDFQHRCSLGERQNVVWGLGYRYSHGDAHSDDEGLISVGMKSHVTQFFSTFAQDELRLVKNRLRLTIGAKLEHNDYTGFEIQPNLRLLWTPHNHHTIWTAVSRAVRTPSRLERDAQLQIGGFIRPDGTPYVIALRGNRNFTSENLLAYEFGYRIQPSSRVSLDLATFYNSYNHLGNYEPDTPFIENTPRPHVVTPLNFNNLLRAKTYGAEITARWDVTLRWRLGVNYSLLRINPQLDPSSTAANVERAVNDNPRHQFHIRSYLKLSRNFEFDTSLYRVGRLRGHQIPAYTRLDLRLGWQLTERLDLSVGGQNLSGSRRPEFDGTSQALRSSEIRPSVYGKLTWRF